MAEEILGSVDEKALWGRLLSSADDRIRLDTLKYLTDRRDGKARQTIEASALLAAQTVPCGMKEIRDALYGKSSE